MCDWSDDKKENVANGNMAYPVEDSQFSSYIVSQYLFIYKKNKKH